jgi:hypothetical protein
MKRRKILQEDEIVSCDLQESAAVESIPVGAAGAAGAAGALIVGTDSDGAPRILRQSEIQFFQNFQVNTDLLRSDILQSQLSAAAFFRSILAIERYNPISSVIESGVASRLIELLKFSENVELKIEVIWCLTNIACGSPNQVKILFDEGAISVLIDMIGPDNEVQVLGEQSMVGLDFILVVYLFYDKFYFTDPI